MKRHFLFATGAEGEGVNGGVAVENQLIGQATAGQVEGWKKANKYGIYGVTVDGHIAYFKTPDLMHVNCALAKASNTAPMACVKELACITFLGGSNEVLTDDRLFLGASSLIKASMEGKTATLVNL